MWSNDQGVVRKVRVYEELGEVVAWGNGGGLGDDVKGTMGFADDNAARIVGIDLEEMLITSDVGARVADALVSTVKERAAQNQEVTETELRDLLKEDSWELFQTIEKENPHAKAVREKFLQELQRLETLLDDDNA